MTRDERERRNRISLLIDMRDRCEDIREKMEAKHSSGLLPISWSSHNGGHLFVDSVDERSGRFSSIGRYLTHVAENSAGVL
jgi:hypothetical protein